MASSIRVRFAPSPTGHLHIGSARTALFNYLCARAHKGTYVIRIEDTDVARSRVEYAESLLRSLQWLTLESDEPIVYQLSNVEEHRKIIDHLVHEGKAYRCFCQPHEKVKEKEDYKNTDEQQLDEQRCHCGTLQLQEGDTTRPHGVRFKVSDDQGPITFHDLIRGPITFQPDQLHDFIIMRRDGIPTYNFSVVVDDIGMKISHVIRGEDHISNTPKQIMLYQALGKQLPHFAHLPMILGPSGNRLSKRDGAVSVEEYRIQGFLPEALNNYLVRLGWAHGDQEIFTLAELTSFFTLSDVSKKAALFDIKKLEWVNSVYIKQASVTALFQRCDEMEQGVITRLKSLWQEHQLVALFELYKGRVATLKELVESVEKLAHAPTMYDAALIAQWQQEPVRAMLTQLLDELAQTDLFLHSYLAERGKSIAQQHAQKITVIALFLRYALLQECKGPGVFELMAIVGKDEALSRIRALYAATF